LKAQYSEAVENIGVNEWYLVLCTDHARHHNTIRAICSEFKTYRRAKVILPRSALSFYELDSLDIPCAITNFLCEDDLILNKAKSDLWRLSSCASYILISLICRSLGGSRTVSAEDLSMLQTDWLGVHSMVRQADLNDDEPDEDGEETPSDDETDNGEGSDDETDLAEIVESLQYTGVLVPTESDYYALAPEEMPALCALYFDQIFRNPLAKGHMAEYLWKLLQP
jgi:hypothetical protein